MYDWITSIADHIYRIIYNFIYQDFVPRSEYEELKMKVEALEKVITQLERKAYEKALAKICLERNCDGYKIGNKSCFPMEFKGKKRIICIEPM